MIPYRKGSPVPCQTYPVWNDRELLRCVSARIILWELEVAMTSLIASGPPAAHAASRLVVNQETDNATSSYIQDLLRKTEEKRDERRVERLNNYYKRNFKEYFEYEASSPTLAARRGIKPETQAAIAKWLEDNK